MPPLFCRSTLSTRTWSVRSPTRRLLNKQRGFFSLLWLSPTELTLPRSWQNCWISRVWNVFWRRHHFCIPDQHITNVRVLSSLLRLPISPTRDGLIKELALLNISELAVEPVRNLYNLLELEFSPLRLAIKVNTELEKLTELGRDDYLQYVEELKNVVATKVLRQVGSI